MIETRLISPVEKFITASCPTCHHQRRVRMTGSFGETHCIYCGADFEWAATGSEVEGTARKDWFAALNRIKNRQNRLEDEV
jgi:hypothetical protein